MTVTVGTAFSRDRAWFTAQDVPWARSHRCRRQHTCTTMSEWSTLTHRSHQTASIPAIGRSAEHTGDRRARAVVTARPVCRTSG